MPAYLYGALNVKIPLTGERRIDPPELLKALRIQQAEMVPSKDWITADEETFRRFNGLVILRF